MRSAIADIDGLPAWGAWTAHGSRSIVQSILDTIERLNPFPEKSALDRFVAAARDLLLE